MVERKDDTPDDRPFLSRWSERKRRSEPEPDLERGPPDPDRERVEGADAGAADEELAANRAAAEAIDIDGLDENSDYSPFFKDGVSPDLKSVALQRLWRSNPIFANIDGLNDYDEDFTIPKTPMGAIRTAWKLGRGYITDDDVADKDETASDLQTAETGDDEDEAVAEADTSEPDPASDDDTERDPGPAPPDPEPPDTELADATGEEPDLRPAPGVGLRNRLDMAAFSGRDDD